MKKVTFLALHLGYGGVEKAIANEANILCNFCDCQVEIISAYKLYEKPPFYTDPKVKITYLMEEKPNKEEFKKAIRSKNPVKILKEGLYSVKVLRKRTSLMKKALLNSDSDIIISSRYLYNKILEKYAPKTAVKIAQEHRYHNNDEKYIGKLCESVKNLDYFMPVSQELTEFYGDRLKGERVKCAYIPHSIDLFPETPSQLTEKNIIAVGRAEKEKGFEDLIEIFAGMHKELPDWKLNIVGGGSLEKPLAQLVKEKGLENFVTLHGYRDKSYINKLLAKSSIYTMTSLEESFGIVIIEAQSFGIPCMAFSSARGALEVIKDGVNGFIINDRDLEKYEKTLIRLAKSPELRKTLGDKGRENAEKYREDNVAKMWQEFLSAIETEG